MMDKPRIEYCNKISGEVVDAALKIHKALGPGLYERVYKDCLCHELQQRNIPFQTEVNIPLVYEGMNFPKAFRADIIVDECVLVEIKAIERFSPLHKSQIITYLRLSGHPVGLLINFNTNLIKEGIKRVVL